MKQFQSGVGLIEVMVAILIISVGLLGVASLQGLSLSEGASSYFNTQAQMATNDIIDRMIANRTQATTGAYAAPIPAAKPQPDCDTLGCTPTEIVTHDLWQVFDNINSTTSLPQSALNITYNNILFEYSVALTWNASGNSDDYTPSSCSVGNTLNSGCMFTTRRLQ